MTHEKLLLMRQEAAAALRRMDWDYFKTREFHEFCGVKLSESGNGPPENDEPAGEH